MDHSRLFQITDVPGFNSQFGRLVSMMNYARWTTLESIKELTIEQLDYLHDAESNSIGALLRHIAAIEFAYQIHTFEKRRLNEREKQEWGAALELGDKGRAEIKGNHLDNYISCLTDVREKTLKTFSQLGDHWLEEESYPHGYFLNQSSNNYFKWFHVFEDEINHRGQIRLIRKKIGIRPI